MFFSISKSFLSLLLIIPLLIGQTTAAWPNGPFTTSGRQILNSLKQPVVYAGVNWPGAADVMIPEGLQYASIATIVTKIKSLGMNVIRLTYAIEMVDDIFAGNGKDVTVQAALVKALGSVNGSLVFAEIMKFNPGLGTAVTRLQVSPFRCIFSLVTSRSGLDP